MGLREQCVSVAGRAWARMVAALGLLVVSVLPAAGQDRWRGEIELPGGAGTLRFVAVFDGSGATPRATMDIPQQGLSGGELHDVMYTGASGSEARFTLRPPRAPESAWARFVVTISEDGEKASGTLSQAGMEMLVRMSKEAAQLGPGGDGGQPGEGDGEVRNGNAGTDRVWSGKILLPGGQTLGFQVVLTPRGGKEGGTTWTGVMDIPAQGMTGGDMIDVDVDESRMKFTLAAKGMPEAAYAKFEMTTRAGEGGKGGTATGTMAQMGQTYPVEMTEGLLVAEKRPQDPVGDRGYAAVEVTFENTVNPATLAGTLYVPGKEFTGPFACAVLISGSGPQNRHEELMGHRPFLVLADDLARRGIAVLAVDDRGVGGSTGDFGAAITETFATDVEAALDFLKTRAEVDPTRLGLVGHSEGGVIGPMVAARRNDVAFLVLLAGYSVTGGELLRVQSRLLAKAAGADAVAAEEAGKGSDELVALVRAGADREKIIERIIAGLPAQMTHGRDEKTIRQIAEGAAAMPASAWFKFFVDYDPRGALGKVRCPVLAVNGTLDMQVWHEQNLPEIEKALREGGSTDFTVMKLEGLNHMLQKARTGATAEYAAIDETINPEALKIVGEWIVARTKK